MLPVWTPMRWPSAWNDPAAVDLLKDTAIDYLLIEKGEALAGVRARAQQNGLKVADAGGSVPGIAIRKGEWPGVRMSRGPRDSVSAGPTGVPWVNSNGWLVRLSAALDPQSAVWIDAVPEKNTLTPADSYGMAVADSAAYGGRWIISLDDQLAAGLSNRRADSLASWKKIADAAGYFAPRKAWTDYTAEATVGVVSDFARKNEFFSHEMLNLLARAGQHYRILPKDRLARSSFEGLRAVIYTDEEPAESTVQKLILDFVQAGGMLITVPKWGPAPGALVKADGKADVCPRFTMRALGKGKIAQADSDPSDPYMMANDSVVLVSHRYDLVRFWNGGATGSYYTISADRKKALVHLFFYAGRGPDSATVRIAGRFRTAGFSTIDHPERRSSETVLQKDALEVPLPQVPPYVALELEN